MTDSTDPKILFWDTEWTPAVSYTWSLYPERLGTGMVVEEPRLICWGARWSDKKSVKVVDERDGRKEMLLEIRDLLSEADMVVSYNGQSFDTKKVNGEFFREGLTPPAPYKEIDLFRVVKRNFTYLSHKLDWVAEIAGVGKKVDTGGFQLWRDVMAGDEKAWKKMRSYQKQDVDLLVDLFEKLKPWIKMPHPISAAEGVLCRNCASTNLERRGYALTLNGKYQRYQCNDCGRWTRGQSRIPVSEVRDIS